MNFERVGRQYPRLAAALSDRDDAHIAVGRLVNEGLARTGVVVADRSVDYLKALAASLDDAAWNLQDREHAGEALTESYADAFRKARAVTALADFMELRDDDAAYEAFHALGVDEEAALGYL